MIAAFSTALTDGGLPTAASDTAARKALRLLLAAASDPGEAIHPE